MYTEISHNYGRIIIFLQQLNYNNSRKMSLIEDPGQTDHLLTLTCNLRMTVVTHTQAKDQGQRLVGSKDGVETGGQTYEWTDGLERCITSHHTRSVKIINMIYTMKTT